MHSMKKTSVILLIGLFLLSACLRETTATSVPATAAALPSLTPTRVLPTPASSGDEITWNNLRVSMDRLETTKNYVTDYGSSRIPPDGQQFLWVHLRIKNMGQAQLEIPVLEHFSILYAAAELKPTYGHRQNYTDYSTLGSVISPAQELDGWLRFDIPAAAELSDLRFVFLPESAQIGTSFNSPIYPYSNNKPTFVWNCAP
jgi:hypothetical protein